MVPSNSAVSLDSNTQKIRVLLAIELEILSIRALVSERLFSIVLVIKVFTSLFVLKPKKAFASFNSKALNVNFSVSKTGNGVKLNAIFILF